MRTRWMCVSEVLTAALGLSLLAPTLGQSQQTGYHDYDALTAELRSLADSSPAAALDSIGSSHEGREIWMVEIGAPEGAALDDRPALIVVGNLEGDHLIGSELALETIRFLLSAEGAAETLARQTVYVVPRLNPDGAEARFSEILWERKANARPHDDDNDGRTDEDPPEDLNGDGLITVMRVEDPGGEYLIDPDNDRLLKRPDRAKGEKGTHAIYWEGRDDDGDGFYNEDGSGGVDLNRNFQHAYAYWQADSGAHMVSEPETRALMDFMLAHRNVGAILTFGHSDNLSTALDSDGDLTGFTHLDLMAFASASNSGVFEVGNFAPAQRGGRGFGGGFRFRGGGGGPQLRGAQPGRDNDPDAGRRPAMSVNEADRPYFSEVGELYREITEVSGATLKRDPAGAFFQYGYFQFGVPSFSTPGWGLPQPEESTDSEGAEDAPVGAGAGGAKEGGPPPGARSRRGRPGGAGGGRGGTGRAAAAGGAGADAQILKGFEAAEIDGFVDWSEYEHPQLGRVEIGGFRPYAAINPPADQIADLGVKHGEFTVRLAAMLPRVKIVNTEVTDHGGGVFTVEAEIENSGLFPTALEHGVVSESVQPTTVQIQVPPESVLTGSAKTSTIEKLEGSGGRESFTWVIRAEPGASVEITVRAQKGGRDSAIVTLQ